MRLFSSLEKSITKWDSLPDCYLSYLYSFIQYYLLSFIVPGTVDVTDKQL